MVTGFSSSRDAALPADSAGRTRRSAVRSWHWVVVGAFATVYSTALSLVYVEGDDAMSVVFHAMGRNADLQPPYAPYHVAMDLLLSVLPAGEAVVRISAMALSALAAPLALIFALELAFGWSRVPFGRPRIIAAAGVLLAAPEIFYLGLVYQTAMIGLASVLIGHVVFRRALVRFLDDPEAPLRALGVGFPASVALFAFGVGCRWDLGLYGVVILVDASIEIFGAGISPRSRTTRRGAFLSLTWGTLSVALWAALVALGGVGVDDVLAYQRASRSVMLSEAPRELLASLAIMQPLLTPGLVLLAAIGVATILKRWRPEALPVLLGLALVSMWWLRKPKVVLVALPSLLAVALVGWMTLETVRSPAARRAVRCALLGLLAAPWLIGLEARFGDSAYGPGFEVQQISREPHDGLRIRAKVGAGACCPTGEGPRPLAGHASVLLGGGWRRFVTAIDEGVQGAILAARSRGLPIVTDRGSDWITAHLLRDGMVTVDPRFPDAGSSPAPRCSVRRFTSRAGGMLQVIKTAGPLEELDAATIECIRLLSGEDRVVWRSYTGRLRGLFMRTPGAIVEEVAVDAAVIDLSLLSPLSPSRRSSGALDGG